MKRRGIGCIQSHGLGKNKEEILVKVPLRIEDIELPCLPCLRSKMLSNVAS